MAETKTGIWWRIVRPTRKGTRHTRVKAAFWYDARALVARWYSVDQEAVELVRD